MKKEPMVPASGGKGRAAAPFKLERLLIAKHFVRQGFSFSEAASAEVEFGKYDRATASYVADDEVNDRLPQSPQGRRTTLHKIKSETEAPFAREEQRVFHRLGQPLTLPIGLQTPELKRGRPKKRRA